MSSSFQSTAGQIFDSPVNTFVQPVTAIRRSSMADLAQTLETINPVLTKFAVQKTVDQISPFFRRQSQNQNVILRQHGVPLK